MDHVIQMVTAYVVMDGQVQNAINFKSVWNVIQTPAAIVLIAKQNVVNLPF